MINLKFLNSSNNKKTKKLVSNLSVFFSFLVLGFLAINLISPTINSNADTIIDTVGPYSMSMSSVSNVDINIAPTPEQRIYKKEANLSITNTCPDGASVNMVSKTSSSNLVQIDLEEGQIEPYIIEPTTSSDSTTMSNNSWGYSIDNGTNWFKLPTNLESPVSLYNSETSQLDPLALPLLFGVKADITLHSGTYKTEVLYTMTPKPNCYSYNITWDYNNGTKKPDVTYPTSLTWGQTINLSTLTPERDGYTFIGWNNGTTDFDGTETNVNINPNMVTPITMTAQWRDNNAIPDGACTGTYGSQTSINLEINTSKDFDYTGNVQCAYIQKEGYYKLEVWGVQGGGNGSYRPGYGGYAYGNIYSTGKSAIYIFVGQKGHLTNTTKTWYGAWNGGGSHYFNTMQDSTEYNSGTGGGATDISISNSEVYLNSYYIYTRNDYSGRIIVAGGGGGANNASSYTGNGGDGGGYIGGNGSGGNGHSPTTGGTQSAGGTSQGSSSTDYGNPSQAGLGIAASTATKSGNCCATSGGGGYYGGGSAYSGGGSGAGGSGYIGSTKLMSDKGMYMFNSGCSSSTAVDTKTTCTSSTGHAVAYAANTGNGYARITYLGTSI